MRFRMGGISCWVAGCMAALGIAGFAHAAGKMETDPALLLEPIVEQAKPVPPPITTPTQTKKKTQAPITIKGGKSPADKKATVNKSTATKAIKSRKAAATQKTIEPEKKTAKATDAPDKPDAAAEKAANAKAAETRKQDIAKLREIEKQGGAYFYTMDNKPISDEELDKRIEKGDVAGIKTVDLHLQEWKTKTKPEAPKKKAPDKAKSSR